MKEYAVTLEVLAKLLTQVPSPEILKIIIDEQMLNYWPVPIEDEKGERGLELLQQFFQGEFKELEPKLRRDFFSLFEMSPPRCYIHESVWLGKDRLLYGKQTFDVRVWYVKYGLQAHSSDKGPDDHLGLELSFVAYLLSQYMSKKEERMELHENICSFMDEHLMQWGPQCLEKIAEEAETSFYQGLALLIASTLAQLEKRLTRESESIC